MQTNDRQLLDLIQAIDNGKIQLPDFQRDWVWDDNRIKALISSILKEYPVGAAMFLEYGSSSLRFKYRNIEGSPVTKVQPTELILDGQQRLTSIYSALYNKNAVKTRTDTGKEIRRFYYLDIEKTMNPSSDISDAIISVPENRIIKSSLGRVIDLDISTREKEFENKMFPLNIIFDFTETYKWQYEYTAYHKLNPVIVNEFMNFQNEIILKTMRYKMPVIVLEKDTPKEAVCQVFENVNTGGVSLTVFELVTAVFAMDDFDLRKDWEKRRELYFNGDLLEAVTATNFLTACTLLSSYKKGGTVSGKKKDVLEKLTLTDFKACEKELTEGFKKAEMLLQEERIFTSNNLPYTTQLIPLAVICALLGKKIDVTTIKNMVKQWYWCGVLGELYGGITDARYVNDIVGVIEWVNDPTKIPKTIQEAYFSPTRLLTLRSRQSAAYKGIMALILKNHCKDFISGSEMDFILYKSEYIDIHHVFPKAYCEKMKYPENKWNSVINKTPITYSTNREIGGVAPSKYLEKIENKGKVSTPDLNTYLKSHWLDPDYLRTDDFDKHIILRAKKLLDEIEKAMGKTISGRDSEETIKAFGEKLI